MNRQQLPQFLILTVMILLAALSRLLPHPPNFSPIAAIALFGGAYFTDKRLAFFIPITIMLLSDAFIGFHPLVPYVYGSFILIGIIGLWLRNNTKPVSILIGSLAASVLFFLVSNLGVWLMGGYPQNTVGLLECYTAAIPFFRNTIMGDLFYCTILFGCFELAKMKFPVLKNA